MKTDKHIITIALQKWQDKQSLLSRTTKLQTAVEADDLRANVRIYFKFQGKKEKLRAYSRKGAKSPRFLTGFFGFLCVFAPLRDHSCSVGAGFALLFKVDT